MTLEEALIRYYGHEGAYQPDIINPSLLEKISKIGTQQYQNIQGLKNKAKKSTPDIYVDLSEETTILELLLLPDEISEYDNLKQDMHSVAQRLYQSCELEIGDMYKVTGCFTVPLKVNVVGRKESTSMYIKRSNLKENPRALGIELFCLVGGFDGFYHYMFDKNIVVESEIKGYHLHNFPHTRDSKEYIEKRVGFDILQMYCSLQDIKSDNYVITENDYVHVPIDFETLSPNTFQKDFPFIRENTIDKLGISSQLYDKIFEREEFLLYHRLQTKRQQLERLLELLNVTSNTTLQRVANDITQKITYLEAKYE